MLTILIFFTLIRNNRLNLLIESSHQNSFIIVNKYLCISEVENFNNLKWLNEHLKPIIGDYNVFLKPGIKSITYLIGFQNSTQIFVCHARE